MDENVTKAWSSRNQYQRRLTLLKPVKQCRAMTEKGVLVEVTELRSKVGQIKLSADD
jgi:hypothetical protein